MSDMKKDTSTRDGSSEMGMSKTYKYEKNIPQYYNITSKLIDQNVENGNGDRVAIWYKDQKYTYRKLQQLINKVGNALLILGVHMEDRVMLIMKDSPEAIAGFYGALKIGAIPVPVNYLCKADDFRYLLNNSRARVAILHEEFKKEVIGWKDKLLYLRNTVVVYPQERNGYISFWDFVNHCSDELSVAYTTVDDAAFWSYTEGSTGVPKAAVHLQHDIFTCIENYAKGLLGINRNDIIYSASKIFYSYGLGNSVFYPFAFGASVVLDPDEPTPKKVLETITKHRPTVFFGVPAVYAAMLQVDNLEKKYDLSSLRICVSAGESLPKEIFYEWKKRFDIEILDGIGCTELIHVFISNRPGEVKPGSSGKPVPGYFARIVDDDGKEVPEGEIGTLHVKGDSAAAYYWRYHEMTKTSMLGEWFNTGEKYYCDKDGYYYYCGHGDDMLKVGGIWVSPVEVEETLLSHPSVFQAAVVPYRDEQDLVKPKAFVVLKPGHRASDDLAKEIQTFVKTTIAPHKFPRSIEFINEMPMTATGKIQRYRLR